MILFAPLALLLTAITPAIAAQNGSTLISPVNPDDWLSECFGTFVANCCIAPNDPHIKLSNFDLIAKPAGLCQDHLSCAFEKCDVTGIEQVAETVSNFSAVTYDDVKDSLGELDLPDHIAYIERVADVVRAIRYAKKVGRKISVKSTGHSYTGANTMKGSVQLNLRELTMYTNDSVTVCDGDVLADERGEHFNACRLAVDRGKRALVKVGGGETWSNVYLAVINQNKSEDGFEVVGGAAGSVGAAGGWLQGGGWSIGVERLYGLGVDQVLEFEMVLADERHVRFGPTEWEPAEGFIYPKTTVVRGNCNKNVARDEKEWVWGECDEPVPPFADLWYAVRGGGGGTYGVVTALKYQLHDKRRMQAVFINEEASSGIETKVADVEGGLEIVGRFFIMFLVDLLFKPSNLGLDKATSDLCGSPGLNFNIFELVIICYDDGFEQANAALTARVDASSDAVIMLVADELKSIFASLVIDSFPDLLFQAAEDEPFRPKDRVPDNPLPSFFPGKGFGGWCSAQVPEKWLADGDREDVFLTLSNTSGQHVTGGNVRIAHDQMSAITQAARETGLSSTGLDSLDVELQQRLLTAFLADTVGAGGSFPGITEVNHLCPDSFGPLKSDMMTLCPEEFTIEEKESKCISIQESIWGTETLARLEAIKYKVDPDNLFDCYACVKARNPLEESLAPEAFTAEPDLFTPQPVLFTREPEAFTPEPAPSVPSFP